MNENEFFLIVFVAAIFKLMFTTDSLCSTICILVAVYVFAQ